MKTNILCLLTAAAVLAGPALRAEDKKPEGRPSREELRKKFENATPEEREKMKEKMKEMRERFGGGADGEKFKNMTPEERQAKMKEMREKRDKLAKDLGLDPEELRKLPMDEAMAKFREAAEKKHDELSKKKEAGTLTDAEKDLLQQLDEAKKRRESGRTDGNRPHRPEGEKKEGDKPADKK